MQFSNEFHLRYKKPKLFVHSKGRFIGTGWKKMREKRCPRLFISKVLKLVRTMKGLSPKKRSEGSHCALKEKVRKRQSKGFCHILNSQVQKKKTLS